MKKRNLATLAMIGISAALFVTGCQNQGESEQERGLEEFSSDMDAFYNSLNAEGQNKFKQLDAQHKMMAIEMSRQSCSGQNSCSGMGGCATALHQCAGANACKGGGGFPIQDRNKAVEIQYNNQMRQRQKANGNMDEEPSNKSK